MSSIDLTSAAGQAAVAYQDALNQARNTQNALLRQYGFTAPGVGGEYSVEAAQRAFDPNVLFDKATGGIDQARLQQLAGGLRMGTSGVFGEIARGGASAEAEAVLASRTAGLRGGLAEQRRRLAETQTATQTSQAQQEFLAGLGEAMAPIGGAFQRLQISQAEAKAQEEAARAAASTLPQTPEAEAAAEAAEPAASVFGQGQNVAGGILSAGSRGAYKTKGTPKGNVPAKKPGQTFTGAGGVKWVYRPQGPAGAGWYKK
jgi:hypothetical protein